jgi:hypothetical protein
MNVQRDPDAILAAWLEEGPSALPEPTRRAIAVNTRTTNQRRHPIWMPQRSPTMNPFARIAVAAVAVVAVLGGAIYVFAPGGGVGGGPSATASPSAGLSPSSSPSPLITAVPSPSPTQLAISGDIFPGRYVPQFNPPMTFTIDREIEHHCQPPLSQCRGNIDSNVPAWLYLEFGQPAIEVGINRVDKVNDPAHAGRLIDPPADLAAWIAGRPGLTVIAQKAVTVGGLPGTQLDVRTGNKDVAFGPIPGVTDPASGLGANYVARLFVVRVQGHQILMSLHAADGSIEEIQPVVDSIVWN